MAQLAQAIYKAIDVARKNGISSFLPSDSDVLTPPDSSTHAEIESAFSEVVGRSWSGSELNLRQWAWAARQLENESGRILSSLPRAQGGGIQNVNGRWFVNGQAYSFVEICTANRVHTYFAIDDLLQFNLNTISANNSLTHKLNEIQNKVADSKSGNIYFLVEHLWDDKSDSNAKLSRSKLKELALGLVGTDSVLAVKIDADSIVRGEDWDSVKEELSTMIAAKSADNQIAQQRSESIVNVRSNLLDGLSNLLKGQQNLNGSISRNF